MGFALLLVGINASQSWWILHYQRKERKQKTSFFPPCKVTSVLEPVPLASWNLFFFKVFYFLLLPFQFYSFQTLVMITIVSFGNIFYVYCPGSFGRKGTNNFQEHSWFDGLHQRGNSHVLILVCLGV